jgi:hypothetical protein
MRNKSRATGPAASHGTKSRSCSLGGELGRLLLWGRPSYRAAYLALSWGFSWTARLSHESSRPVHVISRGSRLWKRTVRLDCDRQTVGSAGGIGGERNERHFWRLALMEYPAGCVCRRGAEGRFHSSDGKLGTGGLGSVELPPN